MELTKEAKEQFKTYSNQLIKWLNDNCNPHTSIEITTNSAELKSGEMCHKTDIYIKD